MNPQARRRGAFWNTLSCRRAAHARLKRRDDGVVVGSRDALPEPLEPCLRREHGLVDEDVQLADGARLDAGLDLQRFADPGGETRRACIGDRSDRAVDDADVHGGSPACETEEV